MTEFWHPTKDLVGLPGMPGLRSIRLHGRRRGWISRERIWGKRKIFEWLESSLPEPAQAALRAARRDGGGGAKDFARLCPDAPATEDGPSRPGFEGHPGGPSSAIFLTDTGPVAVMDARTDIVTTFKRWRPDGMSLKPALEKWCALYNAGSAAVTDETRAAIATVSVRTMQRWRQAGGSSSLMPGRGGRTGGIDATPEIRGLTESMLLDNPYHVTARNIIEAIEARYPDAEPPSISTVRRFARRWRVENGYAISAVSDPDGHRSRTMPAFGDKALEVSALNELWELDSTRLDVICADGRRHDVVVALEVWGRRAKAIVTPRSRSTAIAALIRRCLMDWGVPQCVRTDEGKDYTSKHLARVLADLEVDHEILPPFSPWLKPYVERFIGTLSRGLLTQLPGFSGHNVADVARIRAKKSFAERLGDADRKKRIYLDTALTAEELQERIDAWIDNVYARRPHSGLDGASPFEKAVSWAGTPPARVPERGLDILLAPVAGDGRRKIGKDGIHVDGGEYIAGVLGSHMDEWVHVRQDPADWGRIYVFTEPDERGRTEFICIAEDPGRTGIDRAEVAIEAKRLWRKRNAAERKRARELERAHRPKDTIDEVLAAAGRNADTVVAFTPRADVHRTDALDAAAEAEAADAAMEDRERRTLSEVELIKQLYGGQVADLN